MDIRKQKIFRKEKIADRKAEKRGKKNVTKLDIKPTRHLMHFYILRGRYICVTSRRHPLLTREKMMLHVRFCMRDGSHAAGTHCCIVVVIWCQIQVGWWRRKKSRNSYRLTGVKCGGRVESCQRRNTLQNTRRGQSSFGILVPTLFNGMT